DDDRAAVLTLEREVAKSVLQRIHAAEARVLDLGNLAVAVHGRPAGLPQAVVEHALDDHRARGVVRARFGSEAEKADALGIDVVRVAKAHHGRCGDCIIALLGTAHPEAAADGRAGLVPRGARPAAPLLQIDPIRRHVDRKTTDPDLDFHQITPMLEAAASDEGDSQMRLKWSHAADYRAAALESPS